MIDNRTDKGANPVIPAKWGSWSGWSPCSRSCSVGVRERKRICDGGRLKYFPLRGVVLLNIRRRHISKMLRHCMTDITPL